MEYNADREEGREEKERRERGEEGGEREEREHTYWSLQILRKQQNFRS